METKAPKSDWAWVFEAAGFLGWPPESVLKASLPEVILALRGRARALGIDIDAGTQTPMTREDLVSLIERHVP